VRDGVSAGAVQLVREVARVLGRGGAAAFTEFGGDFPPAPVELTDGTVLAEARGMFMRMPDELADATVDQYPEFVHYWQS